MNQQNKREYELYKNNFLRKSDTVQTVEGCLKIVKDWLRFFKDGHLMTRNLIRQGSSRKVEIKYTEIDKNAGILIIPSFNHIYKKEIDSVLLANEKMILSKPVLIIDIRNNGGGSDVTFSKLIPYLYTNPIITISSSIYSTPENIRKFEKTINDPLFPAREKDYFRTLIDKMRKSLYGYVERPDDTLTLHRIFPAPALVGIIYNKKTISSAEGFVLKARQSKKVILFGENSGGVLDYANMNWVKFPCLDNELGYGTSRSNRLPDQPVDNFGITPDVLFVLGISDWISEAKGYLYDLLLKKKD